MEAEVEKRCNQDDRQLAYIHSQKVTKSVHTSSGFSTMKYEIKHLQLKDETDMEKMVLVTTSSSRFLLKEEPKIRYVQTLILELYLQKSTDTLSYCKVQDGSKASNYGNVTSESYYILLVFHGSIQNGGAMRSYGGGNLWVWTSMATSFVTLTPLKCKHLKYLITRK